MGLGSLLRGITFDAGARPVVHTTTRLALAGATESALLLLRRRRWLGRLDLRWSRRLSRRGVPELPRLWTALLGFLGDIPAHHELIGLFGALVSRRSAALWRRSRRVSCWGCCFRLWSPLRGGVSLSEAGQKTRAPRAPPSCRGSSVLQPAPRRRGHRNCSRASCPHRRRISGCAGLLARCRRRRPEAVPAAGWLLCLSSVLQPAPRRRGHRNCSRASCPPRRRISGCAGLLARCRRRRPEAAPAAGRLLCLRVVCQ